MLTGLRPLSLGAAVSARGAEPSGAPTTGDWGRRSVRRWPGSPRPAVSTRGDGLPEPAGAGLRPAGEPAVSGWDGGALEGYLPAETVLGQIEAAVVVTDRLSNLLYANSYAAKLFDFPDTPERLVGRSLLSLGFEEEDLGKAAELAKQVLHGRSWDGTFASVRSEGSRVFVRAQAMPLRHPSG